MIKRFILTTIILTFFSAQSQEVMTPKPDYKINVLYIFLPPTWGGVAATTTTLFRLMDKTNFNPYVLIAPNSLIKEYFDKNNFSYFLCVTKINSKGTPTDMPAFAQEVKTICKQNNIDIIHVQWPPTAILIGNEIKKSLPTKIVLTLHGTHVLADNIIQQADAITCVNKKTLEQTNERIEILQTPQEHAIFLPPVFDDSRLISFVAPSYTRQEFFQQNFNLSVGTTPIICTVAHLRAHKNISCLIKAADYLIHQKQTKIHVMLAGKGQTEKTLRAETKKLHLNDYVHFLGHTSQVPELLFFSDIKVLPSKDEAFGIAVVEAALMKKPIIIASKTGLENQLIFHKKTGLIFENNDYIDLAEKIDFLLKNPVIAKELSMSAYDFSISHFSAKSITQQYEKLYESVYYTQPTA